MNIEQEDKEAETIILIRQLIIMPYLPLTFSEEFYVNYTAHGII